jgi:hypothetical protein
MIKNAIYFGLNLNDGLLPQAETFSPPERTSKFQLSEKITQLLKNMKFLLFFFLEPDLLIEKMHTQVLTDFRSK